MPRSARSHLLTFVLLSVFAMVFGAFLVYGGYKYVTGAENVTLKSLAPGLPAVYLGFMARNEFRAMRAARKSEANRRRRADREREVAAGEAAGNS